MSQQITYSLYKISVKSEIMDKKIPLKKIFYKLMKTIKLLRIVSLKMHTDIHWHIGIEIYTPTNIHSYKMHKFVGLSIEIIMKKIYTYVVFICNQVLNTIYLHFNKNVNKCCCTLNDTYTHT